jgi:hypothetical protein
MNILGKLTAQQKAAVQFFADALISKQLQRHISIRFVFTKNFNHFGEIEIVDWNSKGEPREFVCYIHRNLDSAEKIKTLAHEITHLKQYLYKELNEQMTLWKGQRVSEDDYVNYDDRPWEQEAYNMENKLYELFSNTKQR